MWDRITSSFDNFFTGSTWGAILGAIGGALYALTTPSAVPGNELYAMITGGAIGMVGGGFLGGAAGLFSGLAFGGGDQPAEPDAPAPEREKAQTIAQQKEVEEPSPGLLSYLLPEKGQGQNTGRSM